jgi:hypothetical protein
VKRRKSKDSEKERRVSGKDKEKGKKEAIEFN